ncbi:hypothetical protein WJX82_011369 [Trebouxia sp. C0006]
MAAQAAAPRLLRAVAETTQPYGPLLEGNALHTLQEYLSDATQVDVVYLTVLNRASGEPLSLAVVDKCIALLKRYLPRYKASQQVLERAEDFCAHATTSLSAMSPAMQKSLMYLQTMVTRLMGNKRQRRLSKPSPARQHQKSSSDTAVTMPVSTMSRAFSSPVPTLAHQASKSSTRSVTHRLSEQLTLEEDPPGNWAIHHDMLTARFGAGEPDGALCNSMAPFLPSLPHNSARQQEGQEADDRGNNGASSSQEHVRTIAALQRVQASQANFSNDPALDISRPKLRDNRPRLLFQYLPYIQQEALSLDQQDVEAVLEATCGAGGDTGAHSSLWGVEDTEELWKRDNGRQGWGGAGGPQGDSAGQVCAGVLVKLVMDMYLKATPAVAFPLTLVMLHRALNSPASSIRARPFDILYNLSLHAELLYSPTSNPNQGMPESSDPDSVLEGAWAQTQHPVNWPQPESLEGPLAAFRHWLRHLLWELTLLLAQRGERSPQVWSAVLGCLIHLVSHCGYVVRAYLEGLSIKVVLALMQCSLDNQWCDTVYCQLVRLAANMLYIPTIDAQEDDDSKDGSGRPAASLQLSQEQLSEFGGMRQVVAHFKAAPTSEACHNLLAVMLDQATHNMTQATGDGQQQAPMPSPAAISALLPMLTSNNVPSAIQTAFQVGDTGFAAPVAHILQETHQQAQGKDSAQDSVSAQQQQSPSLIRGLLEELEAMAYAESGNIIPLSLQPAVQHTLDCIRRPYQTPLEPLNEPNQSDPRGLLNSALSTADVGLLGLGTSAAEAKEDVGPGHRAGLGGADSRALSSILSTTELTGILQDGERQQGGIVLHDAPLLGHDTLNPPPKLPDGHDDRPAQSGAEGEADRVGGESRGPWQGEAAAGLVLSTLYLAMEWILQAPPPTRQTALQEIAQLLLMFMCTPAAPADTTHPASPPLTPRQPAPSHVMIDIPADDPAHVTIRMPSPQGTASPTPASTPRTAADNQQERLAGLAAGSSLAWCFLAGLVAVPAEVLSQVPPVLLVRLLHHLNPHPTPPATAEQANTGSLGPPIPQGRGRQSVQDTRAALVLLLIARCNVQQTALQQAGGEALFAQLLRDDDARVRYHASMFVQQRLVASKADQYRRALRQLTQQAQQANDEKLLRNPYLQISTMLEMRLIDLSM